MKKQIIILLLISFQTLLCFAQKETYQTKIGFRNSETCLFEFGGMCGVGNKSVNNVKYYTNENNEIIFEIDRDFLTNLEEEKILGQKPEKGKIIYIFDLKKDFIIPNNILITLGIKNLSKIKQGNYLVKIKGDAIIMTLKLE
jgi:hypothetical protein